MHRRGKVMHHRGRRSVCIVGGGVVCIKEGGGAYASEGSMHHRVRTSKCIMEGGIVCIIEGGGAWTSWRGGMHH
jgi:hypothetical protein